MFSADLVTSFTALLTKMSVEHEQPALHTATLVGARGQAILSTLLSVLQSLKAVLQLVIRSRDTAFRDLSCLPALLRTFTLLRAVPTTSLHSSQARRAEQELVESLLAFTQPMVDMAKHDVAKTLWSLMVGEVVKYATSCPLAYCPGLHLFSRLLPLPSPPPSLPALSTARKLWSAHLHPLACSVQDMVGTMAGLGHPPLLVLLERVSNQLAALSPPSALTVLRGVLAALEGLGEKEDRVEAQLLRFLASCCQQPLLKAAALHLLREERSALLTPIQRAFSSPALPAVQPSALAIVRTLCDPSTKPTPSSGLADCLPDSASLVALVDPVVGYLAADASSLSSLNELLHLLQQFAGHPNTAAALHTALLAASSRPCLVLLRRLAVELGSSRGEVLGCLALCLTLATSLEPCLGAGGLSLVLGWREQEEGEQEAAERRRTHPLAVLANRLTEEGEGTDQEARIQVVLLVGSVASIHIFKCQTL